MGKKQVKNWINNMKAWAECAADPERDLMFDGFVSLYNNRSKCPYEIAADLPSKSTDARAARAGEYYWEETAEVKQVPLTADDISPSDLFRRESISKQRWVKSVALYDDCVLFRGRAVDFDEISSKYKRSQDDGKTWHPCTKDAPDE